MNMQQRTGHTPRQTLSQYPVHMIYTYMDGHARNTSAIRRHVAEHVARRGLINAVRPAACIVQCLARDQITHPDLASGTTHWGYWSSGPGVVLIPSPAVEADAMGPLRDADADETVLTVTYTAVARINNAVQESTQSQRSSGVVRVCWADKREK